MDMDGFIASFTFKLPPVFLGRTGYRVVLDG